MWREQRHVKRCARWGSRLCGAGATQVGGAATPRARASECAGRQAHKTCCPPPHTLPPHTQTHSCTCAEAIELLSQAVVCDEQQLEGGAQRSEGASAYALLGAAHHALCQWGEAASALEAALRLDPHDTAASKALQGVRKRIQVERAARQAQAATERHALVLKLRAARRADQQLAMLNQFKQSMVGPDWELEDLEW